MSKKIRDLVMNKNRWKTVKYKNVEVYYRDTLDGGGKDQLNQVYVDSVKKLFGKVGTVCEFACGPGFIGFSLLANGLCEKLCLIDINPLALAAVSRTIKKNHLSGVVTTFLSDGLSEVPKGQKWDLVVSNPPHFDGKYSGLSSEILLIDPKWRIHKNFYSRVSKHLNKEASVLFLENGLGSSHLTFKKMITDNGLEFVDSFLCRPSRFEILKILFSKINYANLKRLMIPGANNAVTTFVSSLSFRNPHYFVWSKKH